MVKNVNACQAAYETLNVALFYLNTLSTIFTISIFFSIFSLWFLSHRVASLFILFFFFFSFFFFISFLPLHGYSSGWHHFFFPVSFLMVGSRDLLNFELLNPPKFSPTNLQFIFPLIYVPSHSHLPSWRYHGTQFTVEFWYSRSRWGWFACKERRFSLVKLTGVDGHLAGISSGPVLYKPSPPSFTPKTHMKFLISYQIVLIFVKECDFVVFWEVWNCCLFWFGIFNKAKLVLSVKGEKS